VAATSGTSDSIARIAVGRFSMIGKSLPVPPDHRKAAAGRHERRITEMRAEMLRKTVILIIGVAV
jgi:hypothetical protein